MNKIKKIILATFGAIDVFFYMLTPVLLAILWVNFFGINDSRVYVFYILSLLAMFFRGIKIGWLRND